MQRAGSSRRSPASGSLDRSGKRNSLRGLGGWLAAHEPYYVARSSSPTLSTAPSLSGGGNRNQMAVS